MNYQYLGSLITISIVVDNVAGRSETYENENCKRYDWDEKEYLAFNIIMIMCLSYHDYGYCVL